MDPPSWPAFGTPLYPASGDIDGDGVDEIVVGMGTGAAGWFATLDDVLAEVPSVTWRQVQWQTYASGDGRTHPTVGNFDDDASDEIVVGLGPRSNGWLEFFDDASTSYSHATWHQVEWPEYTVSNGTTWPAAGDLTIDRRDELVVGLGAGGRGWFAIFGGDTAGLTLGKWMQVSWPDYNSESWPSGCLITAGVAHTRSRPGDSRRDVECCATINRSSASAWASCRRTPILCGLHHEYRLAAAAV